MIMKDDAVEKVVPWSVHALFVIGSLIQCFAILVPRHAPCFISFGKFESLEVDLSLLLEVHHAQSISMYAL